MLQYFAPMEGITTHIYRKLHCKYFKGVDYYFTPFISPTMHGNFVPRERKDILPENNKGVPVVPQILTNNIEYFIQTAQELKDYGYASVNLNLGCPSGTVTSKGKGAGALRDLYDLEVFLDGIFARQVLPISIKTRIGYENAEEWEDLLEVFSCYPVQELIVHPRTRQEFYKGEVHQDLFRDTVPKAKMPLGYNGNLVNREQLQWWKEQAGIHSVMLGRGLLRDPALLQEPVVEETYFRFFEELEEAYYEEIGNNALYKLKELWTYAAQRYENVDKVLKKIRKAKNRESYRKAVAEIQMLEKK